MKVFYPKLDRQALIATLRQRTLDLAALLPIREVVLFGSWARGRATALSDIDVLVIYADPPREDAYKLVWRVFHVPGLEPHLYTESEAAVVSATIARMTREGVALL